MKSIEVDESTKWACRDIPRPSAFVQWKGTDVCMDCYCVCGANLHIHGEFAYAVKCNQCQRILVVSASIELRELPEGEMWDGCDPLEPEGM